MTLLYMWIFTSKWIKLLGHYLRYPVDVLLLPVSVLFGYFHGAIKMYAVMTLNVVCFILSNSFYFHLVVFLVFLFDFCSLIWCIYPMCIQAQPLLSSYSSYDNPASQRFDLGLLLPAALFTHYLSVRAIL